MAPSCVYCDYGSINLLSVISKSGLAFSPLYFGVLLAQKSHCTGIGAYSGGTVCLQEKRRMFGCSAVCRTVGGIQYPPSLATFCMSHTFDVASLHGLPCPLQNVRRRLGFSKLEPRDHLDYVNSAVTAVIYVTVYAWVGRRNGLSQMK